MEDIADLIDLDRYPLDARGTDRHDRFISQCRAMHDEVGACNLPEFLRADAVARVREEARAHLSRGYRKTFIRNAYFSGDDPSLPPDHPRRRFWPSETVQVAADQIDAQTMIQRLYRWQPLIDFIGEVEEVPGLYPMADPYQSLNLIALDNGGGSPWHCDINRFTVTLLLCEPEAGGDFVFCPDICSRDEPNYETVRRLFDGDPSLIRHLPRGEGTLTLFRGRNTMHRVEPVMGMTPRISAVLTYDEQPDCVASREININVYGPRVETIYRAQEQAAS